MAFLSGVLEGVKDENEVTTYDNYMPVEKRLNKVLDTLTSSIGSGRDGLAASVAEVKGWLEGYEREVGKRTENLTIGLNWLNDIISQKMLEINAAEFKNLEAIHGAYTEYVAALYRSKSAVRDNSVGYAGLDRELQNKLDTRLCKVEGAIEVLRNSSENNMLAEQVKLVDSTLREHAAELKWKLNESYGKIRSGVTYLKDTKNDQIRYMKRTLRAAQDLVDVFDEDYIEAVIWHFDNIRKHVEDAHTKLSNHQIQLGALVVDAQRYFDVIKKGVGDNGFDGSMYDDWRQLRIQVGNLVEKIKGEGTSTNGDNNQGIEQIKQGISKYAKEFSNGQFRTVLTNWVTEIISDSGGVVSSAIGTYVTVNKGRVKGSKYGERVREVKQAITTILPGRIDTYLKNAAQKVDFQNSTVSDISEHFGRFVGQIESDLIRGGDSSTGAAISAIAAAAQSGSQGTNNDALTAAVNAIVRSIANNMKQIAKELQRFVTESNLQQSLAQIESSLETIRNHVNGESTHFGGRITNNMAQVKDNIDSLTPLLQQTTGKLKSEVDQLQDVLTKLNILKHNKDTDGSVDRGENAAKKQMVKLKDNIQDRLTFITQGVEMSDGALQQRVDDILNVVENSRRVTEQVITDVFNELTAHIQAMLTRQKISQMVALRSFIAEQKFEIEKIIEVDKNNSLKGMLTKLHNHNVKQIQKFIPKTSHASLTSGGASETWQRKKSDEFAAKLHDIFNHFLHHLQTQTELMTDFDKMKPSTTALFDLLDRVIRSQHYDYLVSNKYEDFQNALSKFPADTLPDAPKSVLAPLKRGLQAFTAQLGHAYVNRYSGRKMGELTKKEAAKSSESTPGKADTSPKEITVLTPEGRNCAKVCLTIVEILGHDLGLLKKHCAEKWYSRDMYSTTILGTFMKKCGYGIADSASKQDGELDKNVNGGKIINLLVGDHNKVYNKNKETKNAFENMYKDCLTNYYQVCHFASLFSKKTPCSVYEMLCWLTALPHHPVYIDLTYHDFSDLFDKPKKQVTEDGEDDGPSLIDLGSLSLASYPRTITYGDIHDAITHITYLSPDVLTTILGTGDENTTYAVDYHCNTLRLTYPSSAVECFYMLIEIVGRLFAPLKYLETQCGVASKEYGWAGCLYGKDIKTTKSQCTDHSNAKAMCQPKCKPNSKANCQPNCQPTSPLMNYLTDSLLGHLPHRLVSVGCKSECKTCPTSKRGMPCLTPLGFREFSGSTRKGRDLCDLLSKLFNYTDLRSLFCLVTKPPATLPEHFTFALGFVQGWKDVKTTSKNLIKYTVESSISDRSIGLYKDTEKLTTALVNAYGNSQQKHTHEKTKDPQSADLCSLAMTAPCAAENQCAPYLSSLYSHAYPYFADKHSKNYLSWAVYLPWDFWTYLNELYNDFINILCQEWQCRSCLRGDKCKAGSHGMLNPKVPGDGCQCQSIVSCKGVGPTLYKYGFTYAEPSMLNEKRAPKTCFDFRNMLYSVLNSQYFKDLFKECDEFLWRIREPFSYLVLALWLLSLLYLLHIMVIRLDLLHIKSHIHSPSSHRISAQSLLAAGRVNKLNRVFYLQP